MSMFDETESMPEVADEGEVLALMEQCPFRVLLCAAETEEDTWQPALVWDTDTEDVDPLSKAVFRRLTSLLEDGETVLWSAAVERRRDMVACFARDMGWRWRVLARPPETRH